MENRDCLTALASVCDSATRMHTDNENGQHDPSRLPFSVTYQTSMDDSTEAQNLVESCIRVSFEHASPESSPIAQEQPSASIPALTPQSSPNYINSNDGREVYSSFSTDLQLYSAIEHYRNPVLRNVIAYARFNQYLEETWPENSHRRGSAVIRASFYAAIVNCLKGHDCGTRFRHWVRRNKFFLIENRRPEASGSVAYLGVPACKTLDKTIPKSYKIVARLEDFVYIIGKYHNDEVGHAGIRKTYAMVSTNYSAVCTILL